MRTMKNKTFKLRIRANFARLTALLLFATVISGMPCQRANFMPEPATTVRAPVAPVSVAAAEAEANVAKIVVEGAIDGEVTL